jgi:hypothetical protein
VSVLDLEDLDVLAVAGSHGGERGPAYLLVRCGYAAPFPPVRSADQDTDGCFITVDKNIFHYAFPCGNAAKKLLNPYQARQPLAVVERLYCLPPLRCIQ